MSFATLITLTAGGAVKFWLASLVEGTNHT